MTIENIIFACVTVIVVWLLVSFYRKREEEETHLGWKVFGYYLLGAFSLRLNDFSIPLGFLVYLLVLRPTTNGRTKQKAALLGLAIFFTQLVVPAAIETVYEFPRSVAAIGGSWKEADFTRDWQAIVSRFELAKEDTRLNKFRARYRSDGAVQDLEFEVVSEVEEGYVLYRITTSADTNEYRITRKKLKKWLQYERLGSATRFFEVLDQYHSLHAQQSFHSLDLDSFGKHESYAIKNRKKYLIQKDQLIEITDGQLPIKGFSFITCMNVKDQSASGCESQVDYFYDVTKD